MNGAKAIFYRGLDGVVGLSGCLLLLVLGPVLGAWYYVRNRNFPLKPLVLVGINRRRGGRGPQIKTRNRRHVVMPGRLIHAWCFQVHPDARGPGFSGWSSLVEGLPLSWNLLRGELTLFGPQALPLPEYLRLKRQFPDRTVAPAVKPGLMGLSQLDDDREEVMGAWLRRRELDRKYVARRTVRLDLQILLFTLLEFLPGTGT